MTDPSKPRDQWSSDTPKDRILTAAAAIIASSGVDGATTRAVSAAAGVQAPTIYRLFGDKDGLLEAVAEKVMGDYVATKAARPRQADPVDELRQGWDDHIGFAVAHPGIFRIMSTRTAPADASPALARGIAVLRSKMTAVAATGRLRMPEAQAVDLFHATATGVILMMLRRDDPEPDWAVSDAAREATIMALTGEPVAETSAGTPGIASALRSRLPETRGVSDGERLLLTELLDRIALSND